MPKPNEFAVQTAVSNDDIIPFLKKTGPTTWVDSNITRELFSQSMVISSGNRLVSGGGVIWVTGYTFRVGPAVVDFNGVQITYPQTELTLTSADAVNSRIDLFVANKNTGTIVAITGTASTPAVAPSYDPVNQFQLTAITVDPVSTQPSTVTRTWIYRENTEWTVTVSGGTINANSTSNPFAGTKDIEATTAVNTNFFKLTAPVTFDATTYDTLYFYIRPKADWGTRYLRLHWEASNGSRKGNYVSLTHGTLGFSSTTPSYQLIAIPVSFFGINPGTAVQGLVFTVMSSAGSIGFYMDDIGIQSGVEQTSSPDITIAAIGTSPDGADLTAGKLNNVLLVKRLKAGTNITITAETNDVLIAVGTIPSFINAIFSQSTITYASTITFDFNGPAYQLVTLAGTLILAGTNMGIGKSITIELLADASDRALTYDANWVFYGTSITTVLATKRVMITLKCNGTTAASVRGIAVAQV